MVELTGGGEEPASGVGEGGFVGGEGGVKGEVDGFPVVESGAAELFFGEVEAEGFDEVEGGGGGGAEASDVAGVGGDDGFDEDDVKGDGGPVEGELVALAGAVLHVGVGVHVRRRGGGSERGWVASGRL